MSVLHEGKGGKFGGWVNGWNRIKRKGGQLLLVAVFRSIFFHAVLVVFCVFGHDGGIGVGFDGDIDFGAGLELHFFAVFIFQFVFNPDFFIEMIGAFDADLSLFRFLGKGRLNDLLNLTRQCDARLVWHDISIIQSLVKRASGWNCRNPRRARLVAVDQVLGVAAVVEFIFRFCNAARFSFSLASALASSFLFLVGLVGAAGGVA